MKPLLMLHTKIRTLEILKETNYVIHLNILFFELPTFHTNLQSKIFLLEAIYIRKEEWWSWGQKRKAELIFFFHFT